MYKAAPPTVRCCRYVGLSPYSAPGVFSLLCATELTDGREGLSSSATLGITWCTAGSDFGHSICLGLARTMIHGVYTVFLAGKSPNIRSYTVYIYSSGQPYICVLYATILLCYYTTILLLWCMRTPKPWMTATKLSQMGLVEWARLETQMVQLLLTCAFCVYPILLCHVYINLSNVYHVFLCHLVYQIEQLLCVCFLGSRCIWGRSFICPLSTMCCCLQWRAGVCYPMGGFVYVFLWQSV